MPTTPPLPAATLAKVRARSQSVRFEAVLREVRQFRAYCCNIDSVYIFGVEKEPVAILDISPNPVCLGNAISWNFAGSYAPGSSITSYAIDFGDTSADTGSSGTHTYGATGSYTITGTVTEGGGLTQEIEVEVNVIDCTDLLLLGYIYAATDGSGVWYLE
jgi:PKD repeat protein